MAEHESLIERLNLPDNFGHVLLLLALSLMLAPYLRGLDVGPIKFPNLEPKARSVLLVAGPLLMAGAILLHMKLLPVEGAVSLPPRPGDPPIGEPANAGGPQRATLVPGTDVLVPLSNGACLYPATVVRADDTTAFVHYAFGRDSAVSAPTVRLRGPEEEPAIGLGDRVYALLEAANAWGPGEVRDERDGRLLIALDAGADCVRATDRDTIWIAADTNSIIPMEGNH